MQAPDHGARLPTITPVVQAVENGEIRTLDTIAREWFTDRRMS